MYLKKKLLEVIKIENEKRTDLTTEPLQVPNLFYRSVYLSIYLPAYLRRSLRACLRREKKGTDGGVESSSRARGRPPSHASTVRAHSSLNRRRGQVARAWGDETPRRFLIRRRPHTT